MSKETSKADRETALIPVCLRRELTALRSKNRKVFATSMRLKKHREYSVSIIYDAFFCCFILFSRREGGRIAYRQTGPDGSEIRMRASVEGVKGEHPAHTPCMQGVVGYTACVVSPKKEETVQKESLQACNSISSVKQFRSNDNMKMKIEEKKRENQLCFSSRMQCTAAG